MLWLNDHLRINSNIQGNEYNTIKDLSSISIWLSFRNFNSENQLINSNILKSILRLTFSVWGSLRLCRVHGSFERRWGPCDPRTWDVATVCPSTPSSR